MLDERVVKIKVTGEYACFTRPDLKVERMSYPCMTPSAARGILDSILWKPEFSWYVRRILVLNPVRYISVKRNEIDVKQGKTPVVSDECRVQRNSIVLKDVAYIIEASIYSADDGKKNPPEKYIGRKGVDADHDGIFIRRVTKGQCWRRPFLGTREFSAEFMEADSVEHPLAGDMPIGSMLFDIFYDADGKPQPLFVQDAAVRSGVLTSSKWDDLGMKMMSSSHFRPPMSVSASEAICDVVQYEEREARI